MPNPKYRNNKKNGGNPPPLTDPRVRYVPIGCQKCYECKRQKSREWQLRLTEDIKENVNGVFVTLTYSTESLKSIIENDGKMKRNKSKQYVPLRDLKGYDLDNAIATRSVRLFLERWRKKYGKSVRHWLVTELGHENTEHLHLHGIIWTDKPESIESIWQYGFVWRGYKTRGKRKDIIIENYVSERTINYITKYITKTDQDHKSYQPVILCSPGIGRAYTKTYAFKKHYYNETQTNEAYRTTTGHKVAIPIYWRNKAYTDQQREKLWLIKLDKNERYVCGEKCKGDDITLYKNLLDYHRERTRKLGHGSPVTHDQKTYEEARRRIIHETRLKTSLHTFP